LNLSEIATVLQNLGDYLFAVVSYFLVVVLVQGKELVSKETAFILNEVIQDVPFLL